jgi:hypothetical protein
LLVGGHHIVKMTTWVGVLGLAGALVAGEAGAQTPVGGTPRGVAVDGAVGWAAFADDATIHTRAFGASVRVPVLRRLSVGPEVMYLIGEGGDRDLFVLGSLWLDFIETTPRTRVIPYLVIAGGYMRHSDRFGAQRFVSGDPVIEGGGGARVHLTRRVHAGADVRIGSELHLRTTGYVGVSWPSH